jgi:hypothetical protein
MESSHQYPAARSASLNGDGIRGDPAVEESLDVGGTEGVADGLEALGLRAGGKAVGQLGEVQATPPGLTLGPLVPLTHTLAG